MEISSVTDFFVPEKRDSENLLQRLSQRHLAEWGHLYPGWAVEEAAAEFKTHTRNQIPCTFIAHEGDCLLGSVSLLEEDAPAFSPLGPWLANLYVIPEARKKGIGTKLLFRAMEMAKNLGLQHLYLFTEHGRPFYEKHGWKALRYDFLENHPIVIMHLEP